MARVLVRDRARLALGLLTLSALIRTPLVWALRRFLPGADAVPGIYYTALIFQELLLYALPATLLLRRLRPQRADAPRRLRPWPLWVLLGAAAQYLLQGVSRLWQALLSLLPVSLSPGQVPMPRNPIEGLLAFLALVLTPALAEELLFRRSVFPCLCKGMTQRRAFWLTVGVFALMHGSLAGLPAHLGMGMLTATLFLRTGDLFPAVMVHLSYNMAALLYSLFPPLQFWERIPPMPALLLSVAAAGLLLAPLLHQQRSLSRSAPAEPSRGIGWLAAGLLVLLTLGYLPELLPTP